MDKTPAWGETASASGSGSASDSDSNSGGDTGDQLYCDGEAASYDDSCQACGASVCCDFYLRCMEDDARACWFDCLGSVYDNNECIHEDSLSN